MVRHNPMPMVCAVFEHDWSEYPDKVRVSFPDGKVIDYGNLQKEAKSVLKAMLDRFTYTCYGGQKYKQKNIGKRMGRKEKWASQ